MSYQMLIQAWVCSINCPPASADTQKHCSWRYKPPDKHLKSCLNTAGCLEGRAMLSDCPAVASVGSRASCLSSTWRTAAI